MTNVMIIDLFRNKLSLNLSHYLLLFLLIIPVFIFSFYELIIASNRYESKASVYITEAKSEASGIDLAMLGLSTSSGTQREILVLKAFIESPTLMEILDSDLGLLSHFSSENADYFSRLPRDTEIEYALEYYNKRVTATLDKDANLLEISVQTFDPQYSQKVLERILLHAQNFIDRLNDNVSNSQLTFFNNVVKDSEQELMSEKRALQNFQNKNRIFSTELASKSIAGTIASLEQHLATKQAELKSLSAHLGENSPRLLALKAEISGLQEQIQSENERLAGGTGKTLSELDAEYREIELQIEYKTLRYKAHLEALEAAQLDTARRMKFLTVVSAPTIPEASLYPERGYNIVTAFLISLMVYFMISISIAVIREHA